MKIVLITFVLAALSLRLVRAADAPPASSGPDKFDYAGISSMLDEMIRAVEAQPHPVPHYDPAEQAGIRNRAADPVSFREFANRYWQGREDNLKQAVARLEAIRPALEQILDSEGVPKSLVAVVLVESAAQPFALSPKEARGLWQFVPATARQYGLKVAPENDERVHLEHATHAAARYLRDLYTEFGDWQLALAAYNAGEQTVAKALARSGVRTFAGLSASRSLPPETRNYVPAVMAAMRLLGAVDSAPEYVELPSQKGADRPVYATFRVGG
ncbi:MAG: lytic transglycosylase domain-containing protein [Chloroflexi bacterium]|nr:lytic transglycosylase domain-containing protein [Chloroflexota bacterium]